ncbi:MAG: HAD-IC family P-type ATPase [Candidatus Moranbacteria bacterium]|nr:HAD-IC family P-type ATPase [Candidatus Moranbacteria bacterium]
MKEQSWLENFLKKYQDLGYIIARNVFLFTNGVIALVVALLIVFGDIQAGIFLGLVLFINMTLGLGQDIRAWYALKKLQLLTAPRSLCVRSDGAEESVLTEEIEKGDRLKIKTGDEIPCDGTLMEGHSLELNEGLLTGEAASFSRKKGDHILAGSIITAGSGLLSVDTVFKNSRIARMTEGIKTYQVNESPIQRAVNQVIQYSGYILVLVMGFIVWRGVFTHTSQLTIIKNIGALASTIVPQGLAFAMTLLFAYGAAHLYRRNVLLQEVNATEKLGRIKNLCMDKTGTLTENKPTVEKMMIPRGMSDADARTAIALYIGGSGDSSQTLLALREYVGDVKTTGQVIDTTSFSSWHPYGALETVVMGATHILILGAGESLLPHVADETERAWFANIEKQEAEQGKRIVCLARAQAEHLPKDLSQVKLSLLAVFVLSSRLRPGIREAIQFFQDRKVHIRIISGDHPETVRAVALGAGVKYCDQIVTGKEMQSWTAEDFFKRAGRYSIFARTLPEQKEKIIEALKKDGFTAMVGDGANDALAIKKADLGIAMFEGAPATRQLASVVLMNNSFTALPGGVELADSIIKNAEIFASLFFGVALTGFLLFIGVSALGYPFPLTPLNITLINYFTVGFPGILVSYWTIRPAEKVKTPSTGAFLNIISPFIIWSAVLQVVTILTVFILSPESMKVAASNLFVIFASIIVGYVFFLFAPGIYRGTLLATQRRDLIILTVVEILFLTLVFHIPFFLRFFEIMGSLSGSRILVLAAVSLGIYGLLQYGVARLFRKFSPVSSGIGQNSFLDT